MSLFSSGPCSLTNSKLAILIDDDDEQVAQRRPTFNVAIEGTVLNGVRWISVETYWIRCHRSKACS